MKTRICRLILTFEADDELYSLFQLAEKLGKTVNELLSGRPQPLSTIEQIYWPSYWKIKAKYTEEANKKNSKSKGRNSRSDFDTTSVNDSSIRTMGRQPSK